MDIRSFVHDLISTINPDFSRRNSFEGYHTKGLDYLCLFRSPRLTVKAYLTDPWEFTGTDLGMMDIDGWDGTGVVNPHDHLYPFTQFLIAGEATNVRFSRSTNATYQRQFMLRQWDPVKRQMIGDEVETALEVEDVQRLTMPGDAYYLGRGAVHTISLPRGQRNILVTLQQQSSHERPGSVFYRPGRPPYVTPDLYRPMGAAKFALLLGHLAVAVEPPHPGRVKGPMGAVHGGAMFPPLP